MHFITTVCFMCLRRTKTMTPVTSENGVLQKFKYVYPEVVYTDTDLPRYVCQICYIAVNSFYILKKRSMRTYNRWLGYIRVLQGSYPRDKFGDIQIRIYKSNSKDDEEETNECDEEMQVDEIQQNEIKQQQCNQQKIEENKQTLENKQLYEYNNAAESDDEDKLVIDEDRKQEPVDTKQKEENKSQEVITQDKNETPANSNYEECYYCPVCKKSLTSKLCLTRHFSHMHVRGQDTVTCPLCFKTCRSYFLKHHFRTHLVKALECPICKKQLFRRVSLRSHLKNVHKCTTSLINCALCDEECFGEEMYYRHVTSEEHLAKMKEANSLIKIGEVKINGDNKPLSVL